MIAVLNYGMGNTAAILNMIRRAGGEAYSCKSAEDLERATAIVLPGVGSFDNGMIKLRDSRLLEALEDAVLLGQRPFLGICLGMQLLFEKSEEGKQPGLGWLKGSVTRFDFAGRPSGMRLKIPHMGWNLVNPINYEGLYAGLEDEARFYFVHSYHVNCEDESDVLARSSYGYEFACSVRRGNIWGSQFHPEKSHRFGLKFFENFLRDISNA